MMLDDHLSIQESDLRTRRARSGMFIVMTIVCCLSMTGGNFALCSGPFKIMELSNGL
jgi:hypothetical protein